MIGVATRMAGFPSAPGLRGRRVAVRIAAPSVCLGMLLVLVLAPGAFTTRSPYYREAAQARPGTVQRFGIRGGYVLVTLHRDRYSTRTVVDDDAAATSTDGPVGVAAPASTAQAYAAGLVAAHGWASSEFGCLVRLWDRESSWNAHAENTSSSAYGIPQALPGAKMATAGADWQNDYRVQIRWGIGYIAARYGSPCGAWANSEAVGSY